MNVNYTYLARYEGDTLYVDVRNNNRLIGERKFSIITYNTESALAEIKNEGNNFGFSFDGEYYPPQNNNTPEPPAPAEPYDPENPDNQPSEGAVDGYEFNLPRVTLTDTPDIINTTTLQTNDDLKQKENIQLKSLLESKLSVQDKIANIINAKKELIKISLIPFVLTLLATFGATALQAVVKKLPLSPEQLKSLINCPSSAKISSLIKKRNSLVKQLNNIYTIINVLTKTLAITTVSITALTIGISLAKSIPYPSIGIPALGLPPLTAGQQVRFADALRALQEALLKAGIVVSILTLSLGSFGILLGKIIDLLNSLDMFLQHCAEDQDMDLEQLNDEINALANPTVEATQTPEGNTYKGFTLEVVINKQNTSKYIQRYAQALTPQGIPVLRTESSFASDPAVLISQLKFIIDTNPNITAE
jgi:hypothetical protein